MRVFVCLFVLIFGISSCHKDIEREERKLISSHNIDVIQEINGSVIGIVYDENNEPVTSASVSIYSGTTTTDQRGIFQFNDVHLDARGTYIRITKTGFIDASDKIFPVSSTAFSSIQMISLRKDQSFESDKGGNISVKNGGTIRFQPNTIVEGDGKLYLGKVFVTANFLSPEDDNLGDIMPGDLMAEDDFGRTVILGTAGMMAVELRGQDDQILNLKQGSTAIMEMPNETKSSPTEIDLWSFDEEKGRWKAEGVAILSGDKYIAEVSHFSFWNLDVPFPLIFLCSKVITEDGSPIRTRITIATSDFNTMHGYSDANGEFCGYVPKDAELTIYIKDMFCPSTAAIIVKGPFESDVILEDVIIDNLLPNIVGEVQCLEEKHDNATVLLRSSSRTFVINEINSGEFDINLNTLCTNLPELSIIAYDNANNQASNREDVDLLNLPYYELEVCLNPCEFEGRIIYECGGSSMGVSVTNGTGEYTFLWNGGSTEAEISLLNGTKSYCVTITEELSGCTKEYCKEAGGGAIELYLNADECHGIISGQIINGVPPYSVSTDFGTAFSMNSHSFSEGVSQLGSHCFTVTDKNGCSVSKCISMDYFAEVPYISTWPDVCEKNIYQYNSTFYDFGQIRDVFGNTFTLENYPAMVDVLKTGYAFQTVELYLQGCFYYGSIKLPFFRGLLPSDIRQPSCGTCDDGQITINVDMTAQCYQCVLGSQVVLDESLNDVSAQNTSGSLSAGLYYVVVFDAETNCFVAHEKILLE